VLWERLGEAARVTVLSAAPGSGKTVLLRSWISAAGLAEYAAWVPAGRDEGDPQRLWLAMLDALRQTAPGSGLVRPLTAAPDLDGWAIMARLLTDLAPLRDQLWLVLDDLHELDSDQARRQLELLVMRAPAELRFVMATRHDVRLGLHRLRLEGELTEIRADDLRFTVAEARALFQAAGVELPGPTLALLMDRTEGWAAGLRLAALSLAGHPDPDRFAEEFSGSERTVAEYLLAEVLDRQSEQVRLLLLRTSVLERVNGELADLLTGSSGGERVLQDLEEANAFVVSLDVARSWFRYHHLFADLLQLELRRTEPGEVAALHELAAGWFADHGVPGGGDPPCPGGAGLGQGRPPAGRPLGGPETGRSHGNCARAAGRVPRRGFLCRCRAGGRGCGRRAGPGFAAGGGTVPGRGRARPGVGTAQPAPTGAGAARGGPAVVPRAQRRPAGAGRAGAAAASGGRGPGGGTAHEGGI
jgi:LuxR family maltose regulon positive regulatory protein